MPPVWTCAHLEAQRRPEGGSGFYGRCNLGTYRDRLAWVAEVENRRLEAVRTLSRELAVVSEPVLNRFWESKGKQLRARRSGNDGARETRELRRAAVAIEDVVDRFFVEREDLMAAVGLPIQPTRELIRAALEAMIDQDTTESTFQITDEMLARFPAPVRAFFGHRSAA